MTKEIKLNKKQRFYLNILHKEYEKRVLRNARFSLRKFAYELEIEPSVLSKYFRKQRGITERSFQNIVKLLGLTAESLDKREEEFYRNLSELKLLPEEHQDILKNWHSFVILESLSLIDAQPNIEWISAKTGLKKEIVQKNVTKLFEIGGIAEVDGKWVDQFQNLTFVASENMDTPIGRSFQKNILDESKKSIDLGQKDKKSHTNVIFTIDERLIPEVTKRIRDFRRDICQYLEENEQEKNNVYNLQINFHSLLNYEKQTRSHSCFN
jgi:transcriptional regulator with XRE-family HTH domain